MTSVPIGVAMVEDKDDKRDMVLGSVAMRILTMKAVKQELEGQASVPRDMRFGTLVKQNNKLKNEKLRGVQPACRLCESYACLSRVTHPLDMSRSHSFGSSRIFP